jgi:hypothetical protein
MRANKMMSATAARAIGFVVGLAAAIGGGIGCGLINSDIATLTFQLPSKSFSFDTNNSMWKAPPSSFPRVDCGPAGPVTDCCAPPGGAAVDCNATPLVCAGGVCTLEFPVTLSQTINLKSEVPALANLSGQSLANITISQVQYTVTSTLNVELPPIDIYLAPADVTVADSRASKFVTLPATPAMTSQMKSITPDAAGQAAFAMYGRNFATPFNFIARTTIVVAPGAPVPQGKVDITLSGQVSAKPNL